MRRRLDLKVVGPYGIALLVSAFFYVQALQIAPAANDQLGADLWPKTVLLLAMLTCVWEIGRSLINGAQEPGTPRGDNPDASINPSTDAAEDGAGVESYTPWIGIGLTIAYVAAFPWLGYPVATFVYMAAFVFFGNYRRPLRALCVAFVASLAFMFLFMRIVYVSLPLGVEPFAHVSTWLMHAMGIK